MSVTISVDNVVKRFGEKTIIPGLSIVIRENEFFTLLGPSGCGKTTLLRMIAGFNSIEEGDIFFNDNRVNDVDPAARNIGMVFQNYAIFPHLSVRKNVEFGLRNQGRPKSEIKELAQEYINLVHVDQWADQMPDNLSGGQQQRVALARALVTAPDVLLMDEPLSNLDAKLRVEMREVIREIQQKLGITTVYVTHDQEEAMAVSDRIAVMKEGVIQQLGTPQELYHKPSNLFVAGFIGRTNEVEGTIESPDGQNVILTLGTTAYDIPQSLVDSVSITGPMPVRVSIRPEHLEIHETPFEGALPATVNHTTYLGATTRYFLELEDGSQIEAEQESGLDDASRKGSRVYLRLNTSKINIFSDDGSANLSSFHERRQ
ncbi:ABC transporter ATP-binding protein [Schaalia sp. ZJ1691]|uniref:ABC transporter ATP-binding protein n=1 Tax=Schaalia sp. ZJ1691 TaxID=2709404 RepID=UPI0013EB8BAB|nr:ABC transporter ATP-binding protein [Schaalia sp. ZJ1691]